MKILQSGFIISTPIFLHRNFTNAVFTIYVIVNKFINFPHYSLNISNGFFIFVIIYNNGFVKSKYSFLQIITVFL